MLKSLVPNLYLKMPLEPYTGPFSRNPTSLCVTFGSHSSTADHVTEHSSPNFSFCRRSRHRLDLRQIFVGDLVCDLVSCKFDLMEFRLKCASHWPTCVDFVFDTFRVYHIFLVSISLKIYCLFVITAIQQ